MKRISRMPLALTLTAFGLAFASTGQELPWNVAGGDVDQLITNLTAGRQAKLITRFFRSGQPAADTTPNTVAIERINGYLDTAQQTLIVRGQLYGGPVAEDIRFVDYHDQLIIIRDVDLDGETIDTAPGRSAPVNLEESDDAPRQLGTAMQPRVMGLHTARAVLILYCRRQLLM